MSLGPVERYLGVYGKTGSKPRGEPPKGVNAELKAHPIMPVTLPLPVFVVPGRRRRRKR